MKNKLPIILLVAPALIYACVILIEKMAYLPFAVGIVAVGWVIEEGAKNFWANLTVEISSLHERLDRWAVKSTIESIGRKVDRQIAREQFCKKIWEKLGVYSSAPVDGYSAR